MIQTISPWIPLVVSLGAVAVMRLTLGGRSPLFYVAIFFLYFAFGPVVNFLVGNDVYFGTVTDRIPQASVGFCLAILAMTAASFVFRQRRQFDLADLRLRERDYFVLPAALLCLIAYFVVFLATKGPLVLGAPKDVKLLATNPALHYNVLLAELIVLASYFVIRHDTRTRRIYWANFGLYVVYCLLMSERDFMFVIASIFMHRIVIDRISLRPRHVLGAGALLYAATYMFQLRTGGGVQLASVLNQGSLLFVDTTVIDLAPAYVPHFGGVTYWNAFLNLLPSRLAGTDLNLTAWLVDMYAPGSTSTYGFSLTAEAYLNFGMLGIPAVFFVLSGVQRVLLNRIDRHPFFTFMSVFYTAMWMYALRNDAFTLVKASAYAAVFFLLVHAVSSPSWNAAGRRRARTPSSAHQPRGAHARP